MVQVAPGPLSEKHCLPLSWPFPPPSPACLTLQQGPCNASVMLHLPGLMAAAGAGGTRAPLDHIALRLRSGGLPAHPEAVRV